MYATPRATLDFFTATAQRIRAINSSMDKNSCRSFAKLSAWFVRAFGTLFVLYCFFFDCCIDSSVLYATPRATLDFFTATAQRIRAINSSMDKNSCRSFAKLSAWFVRAFGTLFVLYCFFFDCCIDSSVLYATPRATLDFFTATAQRIRAINSSMDKNSCRSFAKLSAW